MKLIINLPERETVLASNRQRWAEVMSDRSLASHPYRIETNEYGQVIMTPPAGGPHSGRQGNICLELSKRLGGRALPECPECWECDESGQMSYYTEGDSQTRKSQSELCPEFPNQIED